MSLLRHHCKTCSSETLHQKCACTRCGTPMFDKPVQHPGKELFGQIGLKKPVKKRRL